MVYVYKLHLTIRTPLVCLWEQSGQKYHNSVPSRLHGGGEADGDCKEIIRFTWTARGSTPCGRKLFLQFCTFRIQVERPWDLACDSGQRKLTYSLQNHCASSRSVYLSQRLDSHWDKFAVTHHLKEVGVFSTEIKLMFLCSSIKSNG